MAGRTRSRWPVSLWAGTERTNCYSCEDKFLFELADMARGEAKNDPENTPKQQSPFSMRAMCTHTHVSTHIHVLSALALRFDQNTKIETDKQIPPQSHFDSWVYWTCARHTYTRTHTCTAAQWTEIAAVNDVSEWIFYPPSLWCCLCGTLPPRLDFTNHRLSYNERCVQALVRGVQIVECVTNVRAVFKQNKNLYCSALSWLLKDDGGIVCALLAQVGWFTSVFSLFHSCLAG